MPQLAQPKQTDFTFDEDDNQMDSLVPILGLGCCSFSVNPSEFPERVLGSKSEFTILCCGEG
jgi:hypothetical protein